jgi:hypothetical protein
MADKDLPVDSHAQQYDLSSNVQFGASHPPATGASSTIPIVDGRQVVINHAIPLSLQGNTELKVNLAVGGGSVGNYGSSGSSGVANSVLFPNCFSTRALTHLVVEQPEPIKYTGFRVLSKAGVVEPPLVDGWGCPHYNRGLTFPIDIDRYLPPNLSLISRSILIPTVPFFQAQNGTDYDVRCTSSLSVASGSKCFGDDLKSLYPFNHPVEDYVEVSSTDTGVLSTLTSALEFSDPDFKILFGSKAKLNDLRRGALFDGGYLGWPGSPSIKQFYYCSEEYISYLSLSHSAYMYELFNMDYASALAIYGQQGVTAFGPSNPPFGLSMNGAVNVKYVSPRFLDGRHMSSRRYWRNHVSPLVIKPYSPLSFSAGTIQVTPNRGPDTEANEMATLLTGQPSAGSDFFGEMANYLINGGPFRLEVPLQPKPSMTAIFFCAAALFLPPYGVCQESRRDWMRIIARDFGLDTLTPLADVLASDPPLAWMSEIDLWDMCHTCFGLQWSASPIRSAAEPMYGAQVWYVPTIIKEAWSVYTY